MGGEVEEVTKLLTLWEEQNESGSDVTATLTKLAEIFESETEAFLKQDPDPFDDRHPSRLQPDCTLGYMLKAVFKNENIVDEMVKVYCQRDVVELNTVVCRLLLDILPGLESVVFQEEGFVPRLLKWAEKAPNPLQSYATALLAAAMDVPEIAANFRDRNAYFVPLMLRRLHDLSKEYLQDVTVVDRDLISRRPFSHLNNESSDRIGAVPSTSSDETKVTSRKSKRRKDGSKPVRYDPIVSQYKSCNKRSKYKPAEENAVEDNSNSNWPELEQYMIGSYQVYPLTLAAQQRFILQYLTPMGEYQDLMMHIFEENALPLILRYIDLRQNRDVRLAFEALKYLASLLCHKKIAIEFLNIGGLQLLLKVPRPSIAATGVSICLYYLAYIEEAMEKICLSPADIVSEIVSYALWLLECSHDSSRCHATMFFGFAFAFRIILFHFEQQDGLRKLFNVMSTLDIFVLNNSRTLSDDQIFANRQTTKHVCGALKRYFEAQLAAEVDADEDKRQNPFTPKAVNLSYESVECYMQALHEMSKIPMVFWQPVDDFLHLDGVSFVLELISSYFELSYSGRAETVRNAMDVLKICSLTSATQLRFCEKITGPEQNVTGVSVLLSAAEGELLPDPEIQRSALHTIINCVCSKLSVTENSSKSLRSTPKKKSGRNSDDLLNKLWKSVRIKNGIIVLINLLFIKSPLTDADSIRALACKALCGLARSETVKQIIGKLPLITDGLLLDLMKEPVLQDKGRIHVQFSKFGLELIESVTGAPVAAGTESSMLNINKSEIVAKTQIMYNETQLLQLISDHLTARGFIETVTCLQKEMNEKCPPVLPLVPTSFPSRNSTLCPLTLKTRSSKFGASLPSTPTSRSVRSRIIPPPTVPLTIVVNKKSQQASEIKATSCRLQKPQTCSGNYLQSPAMRRQGGTDYITPYSESQPLISLDSIVTEYLRKQHALCKNPMLACPSFDLYAPHKCPEPHQRGNAPTNFAVRIHRREMSFPNGGVGGSARDRKLIYSKFRPVRSIRDEEGRCDFTTCTFLNYDTGKRHPLILAGTQSGCMKAFNVNTAEEELSQECHHRGVMHIESSKSSSLIITADGGRIGNSSLWNLKDNFELVHSFLEASHMEFGKQNLERAIATKQYSASIYDISTFREIKTFPSGDLGNNYLFNRATFDFTDELVLSDGIIFDVKSEKMIHKLDKFNANLNGVFHPNGREIISNSEVWDLRTFKLLRTVPALDQCIVTFNPSGSVIYGVFCNKDMQKIDERMSCFYTFDAHDYSAIATVDVKRPVFHLATDLNERYLATVEYSQQASLPDHFLSPVVGIECISRLYEVGRSKEEGDEGGEDSDDSEEEETDEDMDDDDNEGNENDDEPFDIEEVDEDVMWMSSSISSDEDESLFSLNTSMED